MKFKKIAAATMAGAMALSLAACGGSNTASASTAAGAATSEAAADSNASGEKKLTVTWWGNQTRNERTISTLNLYAEQNPGVTFDPQVAEWADYWNKLATASAGKAIGTLLSSAIVAYGFSRCNFKCKGILFAAMLVTMMLPAQVLMIPQYLWYQKLGWVGTYLPLIVPFFFATQGFFTYLMKNFIDGIPRELDEAAVIDGCSYYGVFGRIILPLMVPALITGAIFSFMWRWDDFLSALLYINSTENYPVCLALKLFCDPSSSSDYGAMFAMSTLSILPAVLIFIFFQKYLVEGISTSGLKG